MVVITPQTLSIAVGAALISYVSYRVLLLAVIATIGGCALYLLARPVPEPDGLPEDLSGNQVCAEQDQDDLREQPSGASTESPRPAAGQVCRLYLDPPPGTVLISIDEKTGIQAKTRIRPDTAPSRSSLR
jgi:hypothetical protein